MHDGTRASRREEFFSSVAGLYDYNLRVNGYFPAVNYVMRHLPLERDAHLTVMDAGCGTGLYSLGALQNFPNCSVYAFDSNAAMANRAKRNVQQRGFNARCEIHIADVENQVRRVESRFDLIITAGLLEYVSAVTVIGSLSQWLKPNGLFLNAPVKDNKLGIAIGRRCHYVPYSRDDNVNMFRRSGLNLVGTIAIPWYFPIALVKEVHLFQRSA